jgi:biotin transporter BioY
MACNYLWTLRGFFAAQYLLVSQESVGVFSLLSLKLQVVFIIVNGAYLNVQEAFLSFLLGRKNDCLAY